MANFPSYPINIVELDGVQLKSRKGLKGPTITEVHDEPEEELAKEPLFPDRFIPKPEPKDPTHSKFDILNELRNVNIKIPLLQALKDIPVYNKMMQELCTQRHKKKDPKTIQVIGQLADLILGNATIPKYADPGSPVIQVSIGTITIPNTLVDLGTIINVMTSETKKKNPWMDLDLLLRYFRWLTDPQLDLRALQKMSFFPLIVEIIQPIL